MGVEHKETKYPENFFHANEVITKISALGYPEKNDHLVKKLFYLVYNGTAFIIAIIFWILEVYYIQVTISDTEQFIRHIGLLFTHGIGAAKFFIMAINRKTVQSIKDSLQDEKYQYKAVGSFQPGKMFIEEKQFLDKVILLMWVLYSGVGISAHISSAISLNGVNGTTFPENVTCYDYLPYYFLIPFSSETTFSCHQALNLMDLSLLFFAWYILNLDVTFVSLLNGLKAQFCIVSEAFKTVRERCVDYMGLKENFEIFLDSQNPELEEKIYNELTHCTKHLNLLLRAHDNIESLFTYITLAQTLASLFIFASCLFLASKVSINSPQFFSQIEYFMAVLTQLSVYCWFGNQITIASDSIADSLYSCDWYSSSLRFKKSIMLTMSGMQRPIYISIGKFTPLTLATLLNVLRGSFSYFTVLKTMD